MIIQRIAKEYKTSLEKAIVYYESLLSLNGIKLRNKELQLLAFTGVRGTITPLSAREEFVKLFDSSLNSIENMKGILVKKGLLIKEGEMYKVLPAISLDFNEPITLVIRMNNGEDEEYVDHGLRDQEDIKEVRDRREDSGEGDSSSVV